MHNLYTTISKTTLQTAIHLYGSIGAVPDAAYGAIEALCKPMIEGHSWEQHREHIPQVIPAGEGFVWEVDERPYEVTRCKFSDRFIKKAVLVLADLIRLENPDWLAGAVNVDWKLKNRLVLSDAHSAHAAAYKDIIGDSSIVYLGEKHHSRITYHEVLRLLPILRGLGFTHFAMEMFHSASQPLLDACARRVYNPENVFGLEELLYWVHRDDHPGIKLDKYTQYIEIAAAAQANDLKVVGIETHSLDAHEINYERLGLGADEIAALPISHKRGALDQLHHRNYHAASVLGPIVEDANHRVAVLGGVDHYGYSEEALVQSVTLNGMMSRFHPNSSGVVVYLRDKGSSPTQLIPDFDVENS